eukprot:gene13525-15991_t
MVSAYCEGGVLRVKGCIRVRISGEMRVYIGRAPATWTDGMDLMNHAADDSDVTIDGDGGENGSCVWIVLDGAGGVMRWWMLHMPPGTVDEADATRAPPEHAACADASCTAEAEAAAPATSKLFAVLRGVEIGPLRASFHHCAVPLGYVHIADLEIDFGPSNTPRIAADGASYQVLAVKPDDGPDVVLVKVGSELWAVEEQCLRETTPGATCRSTEGGVEPGSSAQRLRQASHYSGYGGEEFSLRTGKCDSQDCYAVVTYPLQVVGDSVYVKLESKQISTIETAKHSGD